MRVSFLVGRWSKITIALVCLGLTPGIGQAAETLTYTYDELGRLVGISTSGSVNNGQTVATSFDAAGNRTNYTVSGAAANADNGGGASVPQSQPARYFFNGLFVVMAN